MWIEKLDLSRWGAENGPVLSFTGPPKGFVLVVGDNEAGKSTARLAISALFFGVNDEAEFFGRHGSGAIGARIVLPSGEVLDLVRKQMGREFQLCVLDKLKQEVLLPDEEIRKITGPLDRETYRRLFCFDHLDLEIGSEALLEEDGDLGRILVQTELGRTSLTEARSSIAQRASNLLSPGGRAGVIRQMIRDYQEKMKEASQKRISASRVESIEKEIHALESELRDLGRQKSSLSEQREKIARIRSNISRLRKLDDLEHQLKEIRSGGWTGDSRWADQAEQTIRELVRLKEELIRNQGELADLDSRLGGELATDDLGTKVMSNRNAISQLVTKTHSYQQALQQQEDLTRELQASQERAQAIRASLGIGSEQEPPSAISLEALSDRAQELSDKQRDLERATSSLQEAETALTKQTNELLSLGKSLDLANLEQLIDAARAHQAEIVKEAEEDKNCLDQWATARTIHSSLRWKPEIFASCSMEQLAEIQVPASSQVDKVGLEKSNLGEQLRELHQKVAQLQTKRAELQGQKANVQRSPLPSKETLAHWRHRRDSNWAEIQRRWLNREAPKPDDKTLAENLTEDIKSTDQSADALIDNADTLVQLAKIDQALEQNAADLQACEEDIRARKEQIARQEANWTQLCSELGIVPMEPEEMRSWLEDFSKFKQCVLNAKKSEDNRTHYSNILSQVTLSLEDELSRWMPHGQAPTDPRELTGSQMTQTMLWGQRLESALSRANALLGKEQERLRKIELAKQALAQAQEGFDKAKNELTAIQKAYSRAAQDLSRALEEVRLPGNLTPQAATKAIDAFRELSAKLENQTRLQTELEKYRSFQSSVDQQARELWDLVGKTNPYPATLDLIDNLNQELQRTEELHARQEELRQKRDVLGHRIEDLEGQLAGWFQVATDLLALAVAGRITEIEVPSEFAARATCILDRLEPLLKRTKSAHELEAQLQETERELREANRGHTLADLRQEVEEASHAKDLSSGDPLEEDIEALGEKIAELERQAEERAIALGNKQAERSAMDTQQDAVVLEQQAMNSLAMAGEAIREYVPLVLAQAILARVEEDLSHSPQMDAFLAQASKWFKQLTRDSFDHIELDHRYRASPSKSRTRRRHAGGAPKGGAPLLKPVRKDASGQERSLETLQQLSEGTRDQLYLSLRLAGIVQGFGTADSVPVILDDVLVNFDNERASAALEVLAELGQEIQVLCFTHHRHLADLAKPLKDQGRLTLVEMAKG